MIVVGNTRVACRRKLDIRHRIEPTLADTQTHAGDEIKTTINLT